MRPPYLRRQRRRELARALARYGLDATPPVQMIVYVALLGVALACLIGSAAILLLPHQG